MADGAPIRAEAGPLTLWYRQPARQWTEALPVGNGRLGAMVFGTLPEDLAVTHKPWIHYIWSL